MVRQRYLKREATTRQREAMKAILAKQRERETAEVPPAPPMRCRVCGCTDERACAGGCSWAGPDLCTACIGKLPDTSVCQACRMGYHGEGAGRCTGSTTLGTQLCQCPCNAERRGKAVRRA